MRKSIPTYFICCPRDLLIVMAYTNRTGNYLLVIVKCNSEDDGVNDILRMKTKLPDLSPFRIRSLIICDAHLATIICTTQYHCCTIISFINILVDIFHPSHSRTNCDTNMIITNFREICIIWYNISIINIISIHVVCLTIIAMTINRISILIHSY